jgi:TonB-dependent receptor
MSRRSTHAKQSRPRLAVWSIPLTVALCIAKAKAQDVEQPVVIEEITVTGYTQSLVHALKTKRDADRIVDAISAEDIGKFPSQNIAEALQRVPGVSIVRDRGEGLFVRVRGLGPNFQITTLNGRSMAVNENVRDSGQSGRQFRFDTLPSDIVAGVEVIKSPTADLEEGAMGGVVNVRTFQPLDLGASTFSVSSTASYPEKSDKVDPHASVLGSWVRDDKQLGVLMTVAHDKRTLRQDRALSSSWTSVPGGVDTNGDSVADSGPIIDSTGVRPTLEFEDRRRDGVTFATQWRPNQDIDLNFDAAYTRLQDHYDELTYSADYDRTRLVAGTAVFSNGALVGGTAPVITQIGREESDLEHENFTTGLNAEYRFDQWRLSSDLSWANATSFTPTPIRRSRLRGNAGNVQFSFPESGDAVPSVRFLTADLNNTSVVPGRRLEWRDNDATDTEMAERFDATRGLSWGPMQYVTFGAQHRKRDRDYNRRDLTITNGIAGVTFPAQFFDPFPVSGFLDQASGTLPRTWLVPNTDAFFALMPASAIAAPLTRADLRNSYEISEEITSGYVMTDLMSRIFGRPLRGNVGVRIAQTDQTSSGNADNGTAAIPVTYDTKYTDVLPSMNLALQVTPELLIRAAAAKVITRPSLADLAPRLTLNSSGIILTAVGGNPQLKPFEALQIDSTAEWYFGRASALVGNVFYKDITTFVTQRTSNLVVDGVTYQLTAPINGGKAHVAGLELAYQQLFSFLPQPYDGLGFQLNLTLTDTSATYFDGVRTFEDALENVARRTVNSTVYYEKGPIGARATYSWRGEVLQQVGTNGLASANDRPFGSLDLDLSYRIGDNVTVVAQAINVTNAAQSQFVSGQEFVGYTDYGRTAMLGVRAKF